MMLIKYMSFLFSISSDPPNKIIKVDRLNSSNNVGNNNNNIYIYIYIIDVQDKSEAVEQE